MHNINECVCFRERKHDTLTSCRTTIFCCLVIFSTQTSLTAVSSTHHSSMCAHLSICCCILQNLWITALLHSVYSDLSMNFRPQTQLSGIVMLSSLLTLPPVTLHFFLFFHTIGIIKLQYVFWLTLWGKSGNKKCNCSSSFLYQHQVVKPYMCCP